VSLFPAIAVITRSVRMNVSALIHVCFFPSRTSPSMPMNFTHSGVTGWLTKTVSPTAKPAAFATFSDDAPAGT
jgi:hypothetical protein